MADKHGAKRSQADAELEREIREGRKFTLAEAIGRMAGPGAMKGASPVAGREQAAAAIEHWLSHHLLDSSGALRVVLLRRIKQSELLLSDFDAPLVVLAEYCQQMLDSDYALHELVQEVDIEWGRLLGELPHFDRVGATPHPEDAYTVDSVRKKLSSLIGALAGGEY